jgi:NitT/TauT family transport system permease protein
MNVAGWLVVVAVAALAEVGVRALDLWDSVAAPSAAVRALVDDLRSGELSGELWTTLTTYTEGLAIAVVVGVAVGVALGSSRLLLDASYVVIEFLRPIPAVVLIPAALIVFGYGEPTIRFVVAYAAVWPILINTLYGVRGTDRMLHDVASTSGVTGLARLGRVTVPAALPSIATGIRVSAPIALLVCLTAEFITAAGGLGSYMRERNDALDLAEMYAAVLLAALLGFAINVLLRAAERRAVFWAAEERAA